MHLTTVCFVAAAHAMPSARRQLQQWSFAVQKISRDNSTGDVHLIRILQRVDLNFAAAAQPAGNFAAAACETSMLRAGWSELAVRLFPPPSPPIILHVPHLPCGNEQAERENRPGYNPQSATHYLVSIQASLRLLIPAEAIPVGTRTTLCAVVASPLCGS